MAARGGKSPLNIVFWYNVAAKSGLDRMSAPCRVLHQYEWRHPKVMRLVNDVLDVHEFTIGDDVWVKPPNGSSVSQWSRGRITDVNSVNNVEVDGTPRHVLDIRHLFVEDDDDDSRTSGDSEVEVVNSPLRGSGRVRRTPAWHRDYEM